MDGPQVSSGTDIVALNRFRPRVSASFCPAWFLAWVDVLICPATSERLVQRNQVLVQAGIALDEGGLREVQSTL
jgi:hypothetical protein